MRKRLRQKTTSSNRLGTHISGVAEELAALNDTIACDYQAAAIKLVMKSYAVLDVALQKFQAKTVVRLCAEMRKKWVKAHLLKQLKALECELYGGETFEVELDLYVWEGEERLVKKDLSV
jgi:hypothetical protein